MAASSEPKPPRISALVNIESYIGTLLATILGTLAWNFLVAPHAPVDSVNYFAVLGVGFILQMVGWIVGYSVGLGIARRSLQANEDYAHQAAAYLQKVEEDEQE